MTHHFFHVGQTVTIPNSPKASGMVFKVVKVNPKNLRLKDEDGKQWNAPHSICQPAEGAEFSAPPAPEVPRLVLGSAVTFKVQAEKFPGVYVLIKHLRDDRAQFARLGGHGNRYVTAALTSVAPVDEINNARP